MTYYLYYVYVSAIVRWFTKQESPEQLEIAPGFELKRWAGRRLHPLPFGIDPNQVTSDIRLLEERPTGLSIRVPCRQEIVVPFGPRFDPCRGIGQRPGRYRRSGRSVRFSASVCSLPYPSFRHHSGGFSRWMQNVPLEYPDGTLVPVQYICSRLIRTGRINRDSLVMINSFSDQEAANDDDYGSQQDRDREETDRAYQLFFHASYSI